VTALTDGTPITDPDRLDSFTERQGIRLAAIGDDCDAVIAIGHHRPGKTVKAIAEFLQRDQGWDVESIRSLYDRPRDMGEALHNQWAAFTVGENGRNWQVDWAAEVERPGLIPVMVLYTEL